MGEGAQQDDDLAPLGLAGVDQLAQALGEEARLGDDPRRRAARRRLEVDLLLGPLASVLGAALVERQQQLDRAERRRRRRARR